MRFLDKQENLRGTGRLHALIHIFVPRSDAKAKLSDSISRYRKPFMQTDGPICVLHAKKNGSAMAANQTKKPAGYRLVKTCSMLFWPSTDTPGKRRQSHLYVWDAVLQAHPLICIEKQAPEASLGALCGQTR